MSFNIQRCRKLMSWNFLNDAEKNIRSVAIITFVIGFIAGMLVFMANTKYAGLSLSDPAVMEQFEEDRNANIVTLSLLVIFSLFFYSLYLFSHAFGNKGNKPNTISYLMLPASNLEKFVGRLVYIALLSIAVMFGVYAMVELLRLLLDALLSGPNVGSSITCMESIVSRLLFDNEPGAATEFVRGFTDATAGVENSSAALEEENVFSKIHSFSFPAFIYSICSWTSCIAICVLSSAKFNKARYWLALLGMFLLSFVEGVLKMLLPENDVVIFSFFIVFDLLVICGLLYWSYQLFKHKQLMDRSFTNSLN